MIAHLTWFYLTRTSSCDSARQSSPLAINGDQYNYVMWCTCRSGSQVTVKGKSDSFSILIPTNRKWKERIPNVRQFCRQNFPNIFFGFSNCLLKTVQQSLLFRINLHFCSNTTRSLVIVFHWKRLAFLSHNKSTKPSICIVLMWQVQSDFLVPLETVFTVFLELAIQYSICCFIPWLCVAYLCNKIPTPLSLPAKNPTNLSIWVSSSLSSLRGASTRMELAWCSFDFGVLD